jgi:lipase maturation factor 1
VTALLQRNPFANRPPVYLRAQYYDYHYAGHDEKANGLWWDRRLLGLYFPEVQLPGK